MNKVQKLLARPWQKKRRYLVWKTVIVISPVTKVQYAHDVLCAL